TLQGIIAARLDGLGSDEKALMLDAAVVGKVFWTGALGRDEESTRPTFHSLERKGFVRRQRRSSVEGQSELAFAHALVRDVAYGQIPRADRVTKHRRVAEWIESLGRPEDHAEMRAYHWRAALDLARASGADDDELAERARFALRDAGDRASGLNNHAAAASLYEDALGLWPDDAADRPDLLFRLARALFHAYDEDRRQQALETAREALLAAGDRESAAEAEVFLSHVAWDRGQGELVRDRLRRAEELAGDTVSAAAARVLATSARMHEIADEPDEGLRLGELAVSMAEELGLDELRAHALTTVGMAKNYFDLGSGIEDMERGLALALAIDSRVSSATVNNLAVQAIIAGDLERADMLYTEAFRLAERFGDRSSVRFIRANRIWGHWARGRWREAATEADAFILECEAGSPHTQESIVRAVRGMMRAARGDETGALFDHERAVALVRERQDPVQLQGMLALYVGALAEQGRHGEAGPILEEILPSIRAHGLHGAVSDVALHAEELDVVEALRRAIEEAPGPRVPWRKVCLEALDGRITSAADVFGEMGFLASEAYARLLAGERLVEEGVVGDGENQLVRARAFYRPLDATAYVRRAEARLAGAQSESA
ncbi:MAG: hypothetical protein H0U30_06335, partial [Actinobacteria bacterium]|nr:hypothetical protein [Actinomycetota bacterium]